ncbi:Uncharacterised protein [Vibrio cholerae]|nr:Uncharacterised protein [Vibrio cholerae]
MFTLPTCNGSAREHRLASSCIGISPSYLILGCLSRQHQVIWVYIILIF